MPQRSNDFQRLIYLIERALMPGLTIRESALVTDLQGIEREVDILIEGKLGVHDIRIAVECRDHTRDQEITWIDGLIGKYANLPVDRKIAVSSTPFSESAKSKAAAFRIETITLEDAETEEWVREPGKVRSITMSGFRHEIVKVNFKLAGGPVPRALRGRLQGDKAFIRSGEKKVTVAGALRGAIAEPELKAKIRTAVASHPRLEVNVTLTPKDWHIVGMLGVSRPIVQIDMLVREVREEGVINLAHKTLGDARVKHGYHEGSWFRTDIVVAHLSDADDEGPIRMTIGALSAPKKGKATKKRQK